ncbi:MAG: adenylate/guanylate cyclase domain-containing protein, partial [Chloroflexi bacterium]|nr:adenylate/guanylate cyclase domain-containing protein [Chloroflexota bacterium]
MECPIPRRERLDPELERRYRAGQRKRLLPLLRVGATAGAVLMLAFVLWDRQFDPMHLEATLMVRAVVAAILVAVSAASMTRLASVAQDGLVVVGLWASVTGIMVIGGTIHGHFEGTPAALMLIMLYGSASAGDLRVQAAAGLGYLIIPNAVMYAAGAPPSAVVTVDLFLVTGTGSSLLLAYLADATGRRAFLLEEACAQERRRSEELLRSILPTSVVNRLDGSPQCVADLVDDAGVLFADVVGFTGLAHRVPPAQLVATLDRMFTDLDAVAARHGVEKIKTIGDAYMAAVGVADAAEREVSALADFALEARETVQCHLAGCTAPAVLRIGFSTGPVISGVIGRRKPHFDLWGDTVNTASRLESDGVPGEIQVDERTYLRLRPAYDFEPRGPVELRGLGLVPTYLLKG